MDQIDNNADISIEDNEPETIEELAKPTVDETSKDQPKDQLISDPDNPLADMRKIEGMMESVQGLVSVMEQNWRASARELDIKEEHIKKLMAFNDNHKTPMPDNLTDEEKDKWDHWNGLDQMTEPDIEEIFGKEHTIYGLSHEATIDRIKGACNDFLAWMTTMREYRNIHDAYLQLLELQEEQELLELRKAADETTDEKKKQALLNSIDAYYENKWLGFLAKPLDDKQRDRLLNALSDQKKLEYWINRTRDKLDQLNISQKFILEISQFEKRYLDEKYHKNNNMLLVWFLNECAFCNAGDARDNSRVHVVCTVMGMDAIIRKTWPVDKIDIVMNNIIAFEDQFLPYIKDPVDSEHEITPPINEEDLTN